MLHDEASERDGELEKDKVGPCSVIKRGYEPRMSFYTGNPKETVTHICKELEGEFF